MSAATLGMKLLTKELTKKIRRVVRSGGREPLAKATRRSSQRIAISVRSTSTSAMAAETHRQSAPAAADTTSRGSHQYKAREVSAIATAMRRKRCKTGVSLHFSRALIRRGIVVIIVAAGLLAACGSEGPGTGPTPAIDPPSLSCPVDMIVTGVDGISQAVPFTVPTPIAGTAPVSVTCAPSAGSTFPLGTTPVRCTASDAVARQGFCTFNVTLKGFKIGVTSYLAYGDSVTEGQNGQRIARLDFVDTANAYPTKLQALLTAAFPGQGMAVTNRGFGGERIEDAVVRLPSVLSAERPGGLLLIDGYNNLTSVCSADSGVTPACTAAVDFVVGKLRECIRIARAAPHNVAYVFVGTLTPPGSFTRVPGYFDNRIAAAAITQLNAKIKMQLPSEGAAIVDLHPLFTGHEAEYVSPDGLHILPAGNEVIANAFLSAIKSTIPQTPALAPAGLR